MAYEPINERQITFLIRDGHTHNGLDSSLVYIPPGAIQGYHLADGSGSNSANGAAGKDTKLPGPVLSVGGTEVTGVVVTNLTATTGAAVADIYVDLSWQPPTGMGGADQKSQYQIILIELDNKVPTYATTTDTTFRMHNLKPNTAYSVQVQVIFNSGQLAAPCTAVDFTTGIDTTPPANMTGLEAYAGYTTITVNWTANTDAVMANFSGSYEIDLAVDSAFNNVVQTQTTKGTVLSFGGLTTGQSYYVRGYAISYSGIKQATPTVCSQNPITPGTATPSPSDGVLPTGSVAQPTCIGGPGYIVVKWTPIINHDPVTYEVYASTSSTFTPDTSGHTNLCGSTYATGTGTSSSGQFFAKNINGTAFSYGTNYYFIVYAKDPDGYTTAGPSAVSAAAQMVQVTGTDIAADTITANNIVSNTITAAQIAANTITASQIASQTITAGQIAASTITGDRISGATITGGNIAGSTITGGNIAGGTITASNIQSGTITANQLTSNLILVGNQGIQSNDYAAGAYGWRLWSTTNPSDGNTGNNTSYSFFELNNGIISTSTIQSTNVYGSYIKTVPSGVTTNYIELASPSYSNYVRFVDSSGNRGDLYFAGDQWNFNGGNYMYINVPVTIEGALTVGNVNGSAISGSSLSATYGVSGATLGVSGQMSSYNGNVAANYDGSWYRMTIGGYSVKAVSGEMQIMDSGGSSYQSLHVYNLTTQYGVVTTSSGSLKNNISIFDTCALKAINETNVYNYSFKDDTNSKVGFIAEYVPEDIQRTIPHYEGEVLGLEQTVISAILWKAVQELSDKVDALSGHPVLRSYVDAYLTGTVDLTMGIDALLDQ